MFSIIIPVYNTDIYLKETLQSIYNQTFSDYEIIIVNDGTSFDFSQYKNIKLINIEHSGVSIARNIGAKEAKGTYLLFLDSDDLISPNFLELANKILHKDQSVVAINPKHLYFGDTSGEVEIMVWRSYKEELIKNRLHPTIIIKKEDFDKAGGYDKNLVRYEDWDLYIRMFYKHDRVVNCFEMIHFYRIHELSTLGQLKEDNALKSRQYIYKKNIKIYQEFFEQKN